MLYFIKRWGRVPQRVVRIVRNEAFIYKAENLKTAVNYHGNRIELR